MLTISTTRESTSAEVTEYLSKIILQHFNSYESNVRVTSTRRKGKTMIMSVSSGGQYQFTLTVK